MPVKYTGLVSEIVPHCDCDRLKDSGNHTIVVFSMPSSQARWCCTAVGLLPLFFITLFILIINPPSKVADGTLSFGWYVFFMVLVVTSAAGLLLVYVASKRMHSKTDYTLGGVQYASVLVGLISLLQGFWRAL